MKLENLSTGLKVSNYKQLCQLLEEPIKAGNSKVAQLKEFDRYFSYDKQGNAFLIKEIFDVPKAKDDSRQRYVQLLEPILMNYLSRYTGSTYATWNQWFRTLGMVNVVFYNEEYRETVKDDWNAHFYSLYLLTNIAKNKMKEIVLSSLSNMKKRKLIEFEEKWRIVDTYGQSRFASERDVAYINEVRNEVMRKMGYSSLSPIFLSPKKQKKYTTLLHKRFLKEAKWRNVYKVLEISADKDMVKWYADADVEQLKEKLNRRVCSSVKRAAHTMAETAERKDLDRWMEISDEEWKSSSGSSFSLPRRFTWDVEVLVEYLMLL